MSVATIRRTSASPLAIGVLLFTASCGGGDGSTPTPTPTNRAPVFTSATTASVIENSTGTAYTPAATDADNDTVTITISGGADAAAFTMTGGTLAFASPPNFDRPTDMNTDNSYDVTLAATDGKGGTAALNLSIKISNDHEGVNLTRVASGFGTDAVIAPRTRTSGLLIVSQDGTVRTVEAVTGAIGNAGNVFSSGETGRVLAVTYSNGYGVAMLDIAGRGVIVRSVLLPDSPQQYTVEQTLAAPSTSSPRGAFFVGGDGFVFAALGDPAGDLAQEAGSGYGKFFRIQVDPYCGASLFTYCVGAERFGDGVHAPAGGGGFQGLSFLLDRGTDQQEEISYFNQNARPIDFGWPYREGTYERVANPPPAIIGPSLTYSHGDGFFAGKGLTGGALYTGSIASLANKVLVTDEGGKIFAFPASFLSDGVLHRANEMENRTADFAPTTGAIGRPIAVIRDYAGRLFILDGDGELYGAS
ncbi:hypothetical protein [Sphingomonas hylomeconis]|uniref:Cadherin domain-containing protein n=1 Tax=Sphingomonas hylomeconis TaxID=1395958 RepID=A0ABV7SSI8_9SPHN